MEALEEAYDRALAHEKAGRIDEAAAAWREVIAIDPDDWRIAYAVDTLGFVYETTDAGVHWRDVTGNLDDQFSAASDRKAVTVQVLADVLVPGESRMARNLVVVGGEFALLHCCNLTSSAENART